MNNTENLIACLSASLTLLVKKGTIDESETQTVLKENGYDGLFDLLNEKFKELDK